MFYGKRLKPIYLRSAGICRKTIFFRYNNFLATDFTSYPKMISLRVFFVFTQMEKLYVKVTDDDIYNRITEFKAKNEIIKTRITVMLKKKIWRVKYVHERHAYDKNNTGYVNVGTFLQ